MNKAEEQYLYLWGQSQAKTYIMGWGLLKMDDFTNKIRGFCERSICSDPDIGEVEKGQNDYYNTILRLIENNVITDWPSFVEYMTGETYEKEVKDGI